MATRRKPRKVATSRLEVLPPKRMEAQYRNAMFARLEALAELMREELAPTIERLSFEIDQRADSTMYRGELGRPHFTSALHADSMASNIADFVAKLRTIFITFGRRRSADEVRDLAAVLGKDMSSFNKRRTERWFKTVFGVDPLIGDLKLQATLSAFEAENLRLITKMEAGFVAQVEGEISDALRRGVRAADLEPLIMDRLGVAKSRAKLIARDQLEKLNGNLTELRQTSLGIESYTWQTAEDERVRPEHEDRNGKVFRWDDPPSDGHPGEPIACRCVAIGRVEDVLPEAFDS